MKKARRTEKKQKNFLKMRYSLNCQQALVLKLPICIEPSWSCLSYYTSATKTEDYVQIYFMKWVLHQYQTMKAEKLQTNFTTKY